MESDVGGFAAGPRLVEQTKRTGFQAALPQSRIRLGRKHLLLPLICITQQDCRVSILEIHVCFNTGINFPTEI